MKRVLAVIAALLVAGCSAQAENPAPRPVVATAGGPVRVRLDPAQLARAQITTATAQKRRLGLQVLTGGQVQSAANRTLQVATAVDGLIERVNVQAGDRVQAGQVLAVLKSNDVSQIESELMQQVLELQADRQQAVVQVNLTRSQRDRERKLFDDRIGSRADYEVAQSEYQKALAALTGIDSKRTALITATAERLRLLGALPGEAVRVVGERRVDDRVYIRARRSGIVTERSVNPGELVDADDSKPMFAVADLSEVWLVGQVFEQDIPRVHTGLPVSVRIDSYPGKTFTGRLDYVAAALDPDTRTLAVRATVYNREGRLKPAMFARMTIATGSVQVLSVPAEAVQKSGEIYVAYVPVSGDTFEERPLKLGRTIGNYVEVLAGLKPGEPVVVRGSLQLQGQAQQLAS
ncbi:efflux RND transporter periplasmic adaptor subunit [Gloeobacter kilaueensis]|uniref:RND family efflux transporter MFP subunit n=1 Tax=Gloeobacter kilaueensis (strain ATCC BAA-2537 / CCAP 1431/1 / ULC 316 / JS1) TaxID=1183438 RepID=U5QCK2_GLOK1|nr:efflux RND transporter periplasmic adaptor subunit [Gloeobacter kilaueensis]AGY56606.1 RND family efflux transporter MFP subunit [Gloeobacter kilaueensis JS1]